MENMVQLTWSDLNDALRTADESKCWELLEIEKANGCRVPFLLRIFGKANKLRTERERSKLMSAQQPAPPPVLARSPKDVRTHQKPLPLTKAAPAPAGKARR